MEQLVVFNPGSPVHPLEAAHERFSVPEPMKIVVDEREEAQNVPTEVPIQVDPLSPAQVGFYRFYFPFGRCAKKKVLFTRGPELPRSALHLDS
jgi:hypothetical protein